MHYGATSKIILTMFNPKNFVTLFVLCLFAFTGTAQDCWRTQTIGGWGSKPNGGNPGTYLHQNFPALVETMGEIMIGYGDNMLIFTDAESITDFLPSTGSARTLEGGLQVNPRKRDVRNTFASQILGLTITLSLDRVVADYSESNVYFGNLVVSEGTFEGKSVSYILNMANRALAGEEVPYSISELNEIITKINESYVDGNCNNANMGLLEILGNAGPASRS